jgi:glycosyltransferase involved in cell wall biosynthesis
MLTISVAMATYNGASYLREQLESFLTQSRLPDELIVTDDLSDDSTVDIIKSFSKEAPFPVVVHVNDERLGYVKNFEKAVALATSDIIFLSDQDDVWHPDKLAKHERMYENDPETGAVIGDANVVDDDLKPMGYTLWKHMGLNQARAKKFDTGLGLDLYIKRGFCYGILLSFRSKFREVLIPFPLNYSHDDWITIVLSAITQLRLIPEQLIDYRQHRGQLIGVGLFANENGNSETNAAGLFGPAMALDRVDTFEKRMKEFSATWIRPDVSKVIAGRRRYLKRRKSIYGRSLPVRISGLFVNLLSGDYVRYGSFPKRDLIADLRGV